MVPWLVRTKQAHRRTQAAAFRPRDVQCCARVSPSKVYGMENPCRADASAALMGFLLKLQRHRGLLAAGRVACIRERSDRPPAAPHTRKSRRIEESSACLALCSSKHGARYMVY